MPPPRSRARPRLLLDQLPPSPRARKKECCRDVDRHAGRPPPALMTEVQLINLLRLRRAAPEEVQSGPRIYFATGANPRTIWQLTERSVAQVPRGRFSA